MLGWNQSTWLTMLFGAALKSSFVIAAAWLVTFAMRRRSASSRHLVWTAAGAALLALPLLSVSMPALPVRTAALGPLVPNITFRTTAVAGVDVQAPVQAGHTSQAAPHAAPRADFRISIALLWAAGAALLALHTMAAWMMMWRLRRNARRVDNAPDFPALAQALGIRRNVELLEMAPGAMPLSFGIVRPAVFLPADARQWSDERRRVVMLHELAHVRRGDLASQMLVRMAVTLFWWNPLVWMAWRAFVQERERAADDMVLMAGESATAYAGQLLEIARSMQRVPMLVSAAVAMARPSQLEGRLVAILDARVKRNSPGPRAALAAAALAVALVAPFAALRAQDKPDPAIQPAVDATIKTAVDSHNQDITDAAAAAYAGTQKYDAARQLLDSSLAIRAETSGEHSSAYAVGLMKLGDLSAKRGKVDDAVDFYTRAAALGDTPETAPGLVYLGTHALGLKDPLAAEKFIDRALNAAPSGPVAGRALTVKGNIASANGLTGVAELNYLQALAQDEPNSADAAFTMETYSKFLGEQSRLGEAETMREQALPIRRARVAEISGRVAKGAANASPSGAVFHVGPPSVADNSEFNIMQVDRQLAARAAGTSAPYRVGGGVSAPVLLSKKEPEYSEQARVAKYQGTVVLYVVISPDGQATNVQLIKSLGFGLDEKAAEAVLQWHFKPGQKDGAAVPVEATIEVNFRLL